ncbi:bifunctional proline dehydrogenase/L-glutamate gamma-semialdehyde dehydrogenase PutA, partial [Glaesserella parasuis]|nr:bifunctional proline dehydrogenase/L-glutamate gamma-semialdehyde dehydrogenase PutA [Glaesserella parasuis]
TGEVNFMQFEARPVIAIGNGSLEQQIQALIAVVVSGSRAAVHSNSPLAKQAQHFAGLVIISNDFNSLANLSSLIVLEPLSLEEKAHYAERTGAILTYVENLDLALSLFPLLHEKAISINTAAAGGNASLMSEMD